MHNFKVTYETNLNGVVGIETVELKALSIVAEEHWVTLHHDSTGKETAVVAAFPSKRVVSIIRMDEEV